MQQYVGDNYESTIVHEQFEVPFGAEKARRFIDQKLDGVVANGGEGLIIRSPFAIYTPERSHHILKVKPVNDAEAVVVGYTTGRDGKEQKLRGKMGNLIVKMPSNKKFELSGFTEAERELTDPDWAWDNPDTIVPANIECKTFPRGTTVKYKFRGVTKDGIPVEARYCRD
jgi:DNA ligase-1